MHAFFADCPWTGCALDRNVGIRGLVFEYSMRDFFEAQTEVGVECVVARAC